MNTNTTEYWLKRFTSGDWILKGGNEQQSGFTQDTINNLPQEILNQINGLSICDVNVALGYSLPIFQSTFPNSKIYGIDFIQKVIDIASNNFPQFKFSLELKRNYDVIYTSNSLEHMINWQDVLLDYLNHTNKYLIILVPFKEDITKDTSGEHVIRFDEFSFKDEIGEFKKIYSKIIESKWSSVEQLLTVYSKG